MEKNFGLWVVGSALQEECLRMFGWGSCTGGSFLMAGPDRIHQRRGGKKDIYQGPAPPDKKDTSKHTKK